MRMDAIYLLSIHGSLTLPLDIHNLLANIAGKSVCGETLTIMSSLSVFLGSFHCTTAPIARHYTCQNCLLDVKQQQKRSEEERERGEMVW